MKLKLPKLKNAQKPKIPDADRLAAMAEWGKGRDVNEVAAELFAKHGYPPPKHGAQVFRAFRRRIERLVAEGHQPTIALCREVGLEFEEVKNQ